MKEETIAYNNGCKWLVSEGFREQLPVAFAKISGSLPIQVFTKGFIIIQYSPRWRQSLYAFKEDPLKNACWEAGLSYEKGSPLYVEAKSPEEALKLLKETLQVRFNAARAHLGAFIESCEGKIATLQVRGLQCTDEQTPKN